MALGKEAIEEFFDRIEAKPVKERDTFYNVIFQHLIFYLEKDGHTFILKTRPDAFIHVVDFRDRIVIMERMKRYFIAQEKYELIKGIDIIIEVHQNLIDEGITKDNPNL